MTGDTTASKMPESGKGEGSYEGSKEYAERSEKFVAEKGGEVEKLAQDAAEAVDGEEGADLERAEEEGRSHAKK
jgi:hypothetical protein